MDRKKGTSMSTKGGNLTVYDNAGLLNLGVGSLTFSDLHLNTVSGTL